MLIEVCKSIKLISNDLTLLHRYLCLNFTRSCLLFALLCLVLIGHAQTPVPISAKAVARFEQLVRRTQAVILIGASNSKLPVETRPKLSRVLVESAAEFLRLASHNLTREEYLEILDAGLARLELLAAEGDDRRQVAGYFQDMLDIAGLESSFGRFTVFVDGARAQH